MLVNAIENVSHFTRAIHTISRTYGGVVSPGSATLYFVNEYGVAVTCRHVADMIVSADRINAAFEGFKKERNNLSQNNDREKELMALEQKYNFRNETIVQLKHNFIDCIDEVTDLECIAHPTLDIAILKFKGFKKLIVSSFAHFVKDPGKIKQGRYLCKLGFPFPEFSNYRYNVQTDDIEWTDEGNNKSPVFPTDGIITRLVAGRNAYGDTEINGIETSTLGLKGQSGGPLFDTDSLVYGMQSITGHLHLGFDIHDLELMQEGKITKISNYPFLHVGICVHADRIKEFLAQNNIKFYEA